MRKFYLFEILIISILMLPHPILKAESKGAVIEFKLAYEKATPNTTKVFLNKTNEELFVENQPSLSISDIASATVQVNPPPEYPPSYLKILKEHGATPSSKPSIEIRLKFTDKGAKKVSEITSNNIGRRMAIFIDGKLVMAPKMVEEISEGKLVITGDFTEEEAQSIAERINNSLEKIK